MKSLKSEALATIETKVGSIIGWRMLLPLVLLAALVALSAAGGTQPALADDGGGQNFNVTFTKWITSKGTPPVLFNMVGVVGGDVGDGTFAGELFSDNIVGKVEKIVADYHINGSTHSFSAHVDVSQNDQTGMAVITGQVTDGWLMGAPVTGEYTVWQVCPIPTPGNMFGTLCFQGTLHVHSGG